MDERRWRCVLWALGTVYVGLGGWAGLYAESFALLVANFGPANLHLVRDFAACSLTFGSGLLVAAHRPGWRTPALALAALWNGLHAVSHLYDVTAATPAILGPVEAALLVVITAVFAVLTGISASQGAGAGVDATTVAEGRNYDVD